jgi:hypothetical protein
MYYFLSCITWIPAYNERRCVLPKGTTSSISIFSQEEMFDSRFTRPEQEEILWPINTLEHRLKRI